MKTLSGRLFLFCSLYFLRAFIMAGRIETAISWPASWSSQLEVNLEKLEIMTRTKQAKQQLTS